MAIAFVAGQTVTASAVATPATTTAFSTTPVQGNLIVVTTGDDSATAGSVSRVFDNKGNIYSLVPNSIGILSATVKLWYTIVNVTSASFTVSADWNTGTTGRVVVIAQEFNGFLGKPNVMTSVTTVANGTGTAASSGASPTTTNANALIVGFAIHASTISAFTLGATYSNLGTVNVANAATAMESKVVSALGAQTSTFTIAASRTWNCGVSAFFDDLGGGSPLFNPGQTWRNQFAKGRLHPNQLPFGPDNTPPPAPTNTGGTLPLSGVG